MLNTNKQVFLPQLYLLPFSGSPPSPISYRLPICICSSSKPSRFSPAPHLLSRCKVTPTQETHILGLHDIEWFVVNIWTGTAKKTVHLHLTLMAALNSFNNNFVASLSVEKHFAVNLQLVGWRNIYKKYITHDINSIVYYYIQVTVSFICKRNLNHT